MRRRRYQPQYESKNQPPEGPNWLARDRFRFWFPRPPRGNAIWHSDGTDSRQIIGGATIAHGRGWARARDVLHLLLGLQSAEGNRFSCGRVKQVNEGLNSETYGAYAKLTPDPAKLSGPYVVSLLRHDGDPGVGARKLKELEVLRMLSSLQLPFAIPTPLGAVWEAGQFAFVYEFLEGWPVELRTTHTQIERPWEVVAEIASAVHRLKPAAWPEALPKCATRREYALERLGIFDEWKPEELSKAREWLHAHLPPEDPAVLTHGDLLGQNILRPLEGPPMVIDWEYARLGDPAMDLAFVTRGVAKPFKKGSGLRSFVDAYVAAGGVPLTTTDVHFYELCMAIKWYKESLDRNRGHGPEHYQNIVEGIVRRAESKTE